MDDVCVDDKKVKMSFSTVDCQVTVYNYCGQAKHAHVKNANFNYVSGPLATNGGSYSVSLPSTASSLIVFGESGECPGADGPVSGITRLSVSRHP